MNFLLTKVIDIIFVMKISKRIEEINCLFCYCPLYKEKNCPGTYTMMNDNIKDCTDCTWVHKKENYKRVTVLL